MAEISWSKSKQLIVDGDPRVDYQGPWVINNYNGVDNKGNPQLQTFHSTSQNNATLFIPFTTSSNLSSISVKGALLPGEAQLVANYTVDGGNPVTKEMPIVPGQAVIQPFQEFFGSSVQGPGLHNLSIRVLETGSGRNYSFQSLSVTDADGNGIINSKENKDGLGAGTIAGAVLGSVILLLLCSLAVTFFWRRKRSATNNNDNQQRCQHCASDRPLRPKSITTSRSVGVSPFILPPREPEGALTVANESRPASNGSNSTSLPPYSTFGARMVRSLLIDNSPSTARASYADSFHLSKSAQRDSKNLRILSRT